MNKMTDPIFVGNGAVTPLIQYCQQKQLDHFVIVADENTYHALGQAVEAALKANQFHVQTIILRGTEVITDEHYITQVLFEAPVEPQIYIAVGTGTITDIARFASHRSRNPFISMPTAPSVDGFTSVVAPLVLGGVKQTVPCQGPLAIFADMDTSCAAPHRLLAAGFGDILGKFTSLADWRLDHLVWTERFDVTIEARTRAALMNCVNRAEAIGKGSAEGVRCVMDALIESGLCMLEFGNSSLASGSEHHCSHYWEMKLLQEHRPAVLHGAKVGFATTLIAEQYDRLRSVDRAQAVDRLEQATLPDRAAEIAHIQAGFGPLADTVARDHEAFLSMTPAAFDQLKQRILDNWETIQETAATVPAARQVKAMLRAADAVTDNQGLGLSDAEVQLGLEYGHYLRNRFTVVKLNRILGLM